MLEILKYFTLKAINFSEGKVESKVEREKNGSAGSCIIHTVNLSLQHNTERNSAAHCSTWAVHVTMCRRQALL
jgi:hypothetical protein